MSSPMLCMDRAVCFPAVNAGYSITHVFPYIFQAYSVPITRISSFLKLFDIHLYIIVIQPHTHTKARLSLALLYAPMH